ncbi:MAG: cyclic nucleotide-binding domain-containing protein [Firmicutes bacterium]|nr:cyclic nucleotide-binding domain-containing protein [Bacillota bacterium]
MSSTYSPLNNDDIYNILAEIDPFSSLETRVIKQLVSKVNFKKYAENNFIFRQNEESRKVLFVIISGVIEIRVRNEKGQESVAGYRLQGEFFGETVLLTGKSYPASVKALTNLECLLIPRDEFETLLETNAGFASFFGKVVADRFRSLFNEVATNITPASSYEDKAWRRASELMTYPVITSSPSEKANSIASLMSSNRISAVVLTQEDGTLAGLITEKDLVEKIVAQNSPPGNIQCINIADKNPVCVTTDSYYYQVLLEMIKGQTKHAVVVQDNKPIGIITTRDLIRSRNTSVISVIDKLESQQDIYHLSLVGREIDQILTRLINENAPVPEILDIITEFYDRLTRQVITISIKKMLPDFGPPPAKFCWLTMGSSGRREQYVRTDQDNALLYETINDQQAAKHAENYFAHMSALVIEGLAECGFAHCPGEIMATNPLWRGPESFFKLQVSKWVEGSENLHIRMLTVFLDFRPVYGYLPLAEKLRNFTVDSFANKQLALAFLAQDACQGRLPLSFFGKPVGERTGEHRSEINLKSSVAVHLIDCVRLLALKSKSQSTNTIERLQDLKEYNVLSEDLIDLLETAFQTVMLFRLHINLEKIRSGELPDNYLHLRNLTSRETLLLKDALKAIDKLMNITRETSLIY